MTKNKWYKRVFFLSFHLALINFGISCGAPLALADSGIIYLDENDPTPKRDYKEGSGLNIDIKRIINSSTYEQNQLEDQILTGRTNIFLPEFKAFSLPAGSTYVVQWKFKRQDTGQVTTLPFGNSSAQTPDQWSGWSYQVPSNLAHGRGKAEVTVELREKNANGKKLDSHTSSMDSFFFWSSNDDSHNRSTGNSEPNWFRHWGSDADSAIPNYKADGTVTQYGRDIDFRWGVDNSNYLAYAWAETFYTDDSFINPYIVLTNGIRGQATVNWDSPARTIVTSKIVNNQYKEVSFPEGNISIHYTKKGIDLARIVVAHELRHIDRFDSWAPYGEWRVLYGKRKESNGDNIFDADETDFDNDNLPNESEDAIGTDWRQYETYTTFPRYGTSGDEHIWIENITQNTANGIATKDWSFPGKQSKPKW